MNLTIRVAFKIKAASVPSYFVKADKINLLRSEVVHLFGNVDEKSFGF